MIIYQAQPNKCFPPVSFFLSEQLAKPSFEFEAQLVSSDGTKAFSFQKIDDNGTPLWLDFDGMIENTMPADVKIPRIWQNKPINFLYGIFDEWRVEKQTGDFIFTIISNPVNRIYDVYYFTKATLEKKTLCPNKIGEIVKTINPAFSFPDSLEAFIDQFLAMKGILKFDDYILSPNIYRQQKSFEIFDFVGLVEKMGATLGRLGGRLNVNFPNSWDIFESQLEMDRTYRRHEIEVLMADDLKKFEEIVYYF